MIESATPVSHASPNSTPPGAQLRVKSNLPFVPPHDGVQHLLLTAQPPRMHAVLDDSLFRVMGDAIFINAYPDPKTAKYNYIRLTKTVAQSKGYSDIADYMESLHDGLSTWVSRLARNRTFSLDSVLTFIF